MLEGLFGNRNIERILIFLFVNNHCYGTQLHRCLKTPLTPLQKALNRLENGGLITSYYEGKTRLYQFNPTYPLLAEVEHLLKKAYTLLPTHEKKDYYAIKHESSLLSKREENKIKVLFDCWEKLSKVTKLSFNAKAKSKEKNGWNGQGKGNVYLTKQSNTLIFHEKGVWKNKEDSELNFTNVFRWTFDRHAGLISLEHLRRGIDNPVFLFHMAPCGNHALSSVDSHLCEGDIYFGQIHFDRHGLHLNWRVIGPKKNEEIDYHYS